MANLLPRKPGFVCNICQQARPSIRSTKVSTISSWTQKRKLSHNIQRNTQEQRLQRLRFTRYASTATISAPPSATRSRNSNPQPTPAASSYQGLSPPDTLSAIRRDVSHIMSATTVPDETELLGVLNEMLAFSNTLSSGPKEIPDGEPVQTQPADSGSSVLEALEEQMTDIPQTTAQGMSVTFCMKAADTVCELLYKLVRDPKIHITETVLTTYVNIQCVLGRPEYLPEIFDLFARKPIPMPKTSPIKYKNNSPKSPQNAIPIPLADSALDAAILKKDLALTLAIIDTTVATPSFRRARLLRKATAPLLAVGAGTPLVALSASTWLSHYQNVWDPQVARMTAMAGAMAYIGTLGTIGFITVTTWNDHHDRVVWTPGTGLSERWIREDERRCFDRVACAWGFQERWRRGEEQGEEWEALREVVGSRSMVLDKTNLLDGMQ